MKLLTPTDVRTNNEKRLTINLKRSSDLDGELLRKKQQIEKLDADFKLSIERQRIDFDEEKSEHHKKINELLREVEILEKRKEQALLPINDKLALIEKAQDLLIDRENNIQKKEYQLEESLQSLQDRLDEVTEREQEADRILTKQYSQQKSLDNQKEELAKQTKLLNELLITSNDEFNKKMLILNTKEAEIDSKLNLIEIKESSIKTKEKQLIIKEKGLQDRYATLERSIKRYESSKTR